MMQQFLTLRAPRLRQIPSVAVLPFFETCDPDRACLARQILNLDPWDAESYVDAHMTPLVDAVCDLGALWEQGKCDALPPCLDRICAGAQALGLNKVEMVANDVRMALTQGDAAALGATMARLFRLLEAGFDSFSQP